VSAETGTQSEPEALSRARFIRLVAVVGVLIAVPPISVDLYLPAMPELRDELSASDAWAQFTVTGMLLGLGVGQLFAGPLSDAVGRRRPLLIGLAIHAAASLACAVAPTIMVLNTVRLIQGFAGAAVAVVTIATIRDRLEGAVMARLMSRVMLISGAAPILAPSIGGVLLQFTDWRGVFVIISGAVVVIGFMALTFLDESLPPGKRRSARPRAVAGSYLSLVRDKTFIPMAMIGGLTTAAGLSYVSGSSLVLQDGLGVSSQVFAVLFGINAGCMVLGAQVNPFLIGRFTLVSVMRCGNALGTVSAGVIVVLAVAEVGGVAGFVIPMALVMLGNALVNPNVPALALHRHGGNAGAAAAVMGCLQFGTAAVIAPLVGVIGTQSAAPLGGVVAACLLAAGLLLHNANRDRELRAIGGRAP
jgi:DHA1 family bicyclomycin/chloramphenicol resistance-like MFS transporter